jgi:hypothetical protein
MNGSDIQTQGAGRNRGVATAGTSSRNIHNQSRSLESKSSILLFATTCPTFPNGLAHPGRASDGVRLCPVAGAPGTRVTDDEKIRKGWKLR